MSMSGHLNDSRVGCRNGLAGRQISGELHQGGVVHAMSGAVPFNEDRELPDGRRD